MSLAVHDLKRMGTLAYAEQALIADPDRCLWLYQKLERAVAGDRWQNEPTKRSSQLKAKEAA